MTQVELPVREVPRRRGKPLVGVTLEYVRDPLAMMRRHHDRYGPVSEIRFLGGTWTVLLGPEACEVALRNADKAFANGPGWGFLVGPFFRRGLMLLDFEEHHRHRRLMQEAFTRDRLASYAEQLGPAVARGVGAWQPGPGFRAYPALKSLTLDLATQVFMGGADLADPAELDRVNRAFVDCVQAATAIVRAPLPFTRWGRATARAPGAGGVPAPPPARQAGRARATTCSRCCATLDRRGRRALHRRRRRQPHDLPDDGRARHLDDHRDHDAAAPRAAPGVAGAVPGRVRRAARRRADLAGLRVAGLAGPGDEGVRCGWCRPVPVLARRTVHETEVLGRPVPAGTGSPR